MLTAAVAFVRRWLEAQPILQKVLHNASWLVVDKIIRLGVAVLVMAWVARHLGPTRLGLLTFCQSVVWMIGTFAALGLETVVIRDLVRDRTASAEILGSALVLRTMSAVAGILICVAAMAVLRPVDVLAQQLTWIMMLVLVPQMFDIVDYHFQAVVNAKPIVIVRSSVSIVASLLRCVAVLREDPLLALAWILVGEATLTGALIAGLGVKSRVGFGWRHATRSECKRLFSQSWPLAVSSLSVVLYMRVDQIMLALVAGDAAVGVFSAAVKISEAWYFVPMSILASVAPVLTRTFQSSVTDYERQLIRFGRSLVRLAVVVAAAGSLAAPFLIQLLYGHLYSSAAAVLALHVWAGVFVCIGLMGSNWLINHGLVRFSMYQTIGGAAINIAANALLIPRFGALGAAVASLVAYACAGMFFHLLSSRTRQIFFLQLRACR